MDKITKKIITAFAQAVTIFLGVYGILFSNISAFDIKINEETVIFYCAFAAVCFSIIFFADKYKKILYLSTAGVSLLLFLLNAEKIIDGFKVFLNTLTTLFSRFSSSIDPTESIRLTRSGLLSANTAFFAFLGVLLCFLIAFTLIKLNPLWPTILVTVPIFSLCLIFIKRVPDTNPVFIFLIFLAAINITNLIRQGDSKRGAKMSLIFIPIMLIFLLFVSAVFSSDNYERTDFASDIYSFFSEKIPLTAKKHTTSKESEGSREYSNYSEDSFDTSKPETSKPETSEPINIKDEFLNVDLKNANPNNRTGKVILRVNTDKTGEMLLRGFSLGKYTGTNWEQFDDYSLSKLNIQTIVRPIDNIYNAQSLVCPISLATYTAMISDSKIQNYVGINDMTKGGEVVYTPYYPAFSNLNSLYYYNDSVILYEDNYSSSKNVNPIYAFDVFDCNNIADDNTNNQARKNKNYLSSRQIENNYKKQVYQFYTQINSSAKSFLYDYINGDDFANITDREELVEAVKNYVKNCAKYSLDVPKTPAGKDYMQYFLTESREGYCMHFATTATLIFRTLGVPARYVSGYSVDIKDSQINSRVDVTDRSAHAWTEVYFDGIGWIPVDVTPGTATSRSQPPETSNSGTISKPDDPSKPDDLSKPTESSELAGSNEPVSEISLESSEVPKISLFEKYKDDLLWIISAFIIFSTLIILVVRRKSMQIKRRKFFGQNEINRKAVYTWKYIEKLKPYGIVSEKNVYSISQKAVFSRHTLTDEELNIIVSFATEKGKEVDKKLGFFKRLVFRYIKAMY